MPTPLALPDISDQKPGFVVHGSKVNLAIFADNLADLGVLRPEHWTGSLTQSCENAIAAICTAARPHPLHPMTLSFTDDASALGDDCYRTFNRRGQRSDPVTEFGALCLVMTNDASAPSMFDIGTSLRSLEAARPQLGQTVMAALDKGLSRSCRGLTPRTAFGWCQNVYWRDEKDESELMAEFRAEYTPDEMPTDEKIHEECNIYTRAKFDAALPGWAGSGPIKPLSLAQLKRCRPQPDHQKTVTATIDLLTALECIRSDASKWDRMERVAWEICPYILRWEGMDDPIGGIYDDMVNPMYEGSETLMDINAAFCFWDKPSLRSALNRLRTYLHFMQLSETLITTIGKELPR
jgi:PRTRC genetic system protein F